MPRRHRAREFGGITILVAGIVIGSLGTVLWQGAQTPGGIGAGIRSMLDSFRAAAPGAAKPAENGAPGAPAAPDTPAAKPQIDFDFWDELPGIEVLIPPSTPLPDKPAEAPAASPPASQPAPQPAPRAGGGSIYMLQAASYRSFAEADRLKARLAFAGLKTKIEKVSIQGRGDFYRVRSGPYETFAEMEAARNKLSEAGIKDAMRFRKPR